MEKLQDEELIERYRTELGSAAAEVYLNELFGRHHRKVASWCLRITGDVNSAADLAQEIFLKAFQRLHTFQGTSSFTTWLFSITRNHCLDELRSRATHPQPSSEMVLDEIVDVSCDKVSSALERRESEELLRMLIRESLDETENKVLTLHYVHEMPLDAVSRMLGLTNQSGAKAYIVSARRKLKRAHARWKSRNELPTKGGSRVE
jgi:RNA polymerase sigma-70 factor (ECF subfamily)